MLYTTFTVLLDLCGIGALIAGLLADNLKATMAVGYTVTTVGGVTMLLLTLSCAARCFLAYYVAATTTIKIFY